MATKKPGLIIDVLSGDDEAPPPAEDLPEGEEDAEAPPPRQNAEALIGDIQSQLERLRGML